MNPHLLRSTVLLAVTLGGPEAGAQSQVPPMPAATHALPWRSGTPSFKTVITGAFLGGKVVHAVILNEEQAALHFAPAVHQTVRLLDPQWVVRDLATLPRGSGQDRDRMLGVGPAGLTSAGFDGPEDVFASQVLSTGRWVEARKVRAWRRGTTVQVFGVAGDQVTLLTGILTASGFSNGPELALNSSVVDMVELDWNGDRVAELAVLAGSNLMLFDATLAPMTAWNGQGSGGALARVRAVNSPDRIAWIRPTAANTWELLTAGIAHGQETMPMDLAVNAEGTTTTYLAPLLSSGDANGDHRDDLLVVTPSANRATLLYQKPLAPWFSTQGDAKQLLALGDEIWQALPNLRVAPRLVDLDRDERADLYAVLQDRSKIVARFGIAQNLLGDSTGSLLAADHSTYAHAVPDVGRIRELNIWLNVPTALQMGSYEIEAILWHQRNPYSPINQQGNGNTVWSVIEPDALGVGRFTMTDVDQAECYFTMSVPEPGDGARLYDYFWGQQDHLWLEVTVYGQEGEVFSTYTAGLTMNSIAAGPTQSWYTELASVLETEPFLEYLRSQRDPDSPPMFLREPMGGLPTSAVPGRRMFSAIVIPVGIPPTRDGLPRTTGASPVQTGQVQRG